MNPDQHPPDDVLDLLALGAAGALSDDEYQALEDMLAADPALAREYAELQASASALAEATCEEPPAHLRASILGAIGNVDQLPAAEPALVAAPGRADAAGAVPEEAFPGHRSNVVPIHHRRWMVPATAAAAVLMLLVGGLIFRKVADAPGDRMADVLNADDGVTIELQGPLTGLRLVASDDEDAAVLVGSGLQAPASGMVFQLWAIHGDEKIGMGTFTPAATGEVAVVVEDAGGDAEWAVTVEPEGGSDQPTSDPVAYSPGLA